MEVPSYALIISCKNWFPDKKKNKYKKIQKYP